MARPRKEPEIKLPKAPRKKREPKAPVVAKEVKSTEELVFDNIKALSEASRVNGENTAMLIGKIENMAYHIVAIEEVLAEVVSEIGIDLVEVNKRIRDKIAAGTERLGDPTRAIDAAAAIVSSPFRSY